MESSRGVLQNISARLYKRLLRLYPPRFQREFAGEIQDVFLSRMDDSGIRPWIALQEIAGLAWSILRERWHEWRTGKGDEMDPELKLSSGSGGAAVLRIADLPASGSPWMLGWIFLLPLVILPVTLFASLPFTLPYRWILDVGTKAGLWPAVSESTLQTLGVMTSLGLTIAGAQWFMLRRILPQPGRWFAATAIGIWLGGIAGVMLDLESLLVSGRTPVWNYPVELIVIGLILGQSHWLFLRHQIKRAFWFLFIDFIAAISLLPIRIPIDSTTLLIFVPGIITGFGLWFLLRYSASKEPQAMQLASSRRITSSAWLQIGVGLAVFFLVGLWVNAAVLLENAKARGTYPTLEEAITQLASQGWENSGAKLLRISDVETDPAIVKGVRQHVRWGCATVTMDKIPAGHRWTSFPICTQYVHTRDGWVLMGEGISPFVGFVMELYNLEGVREFRAGNLE